MAINSKFLQNRSIDTIHPFITLNSGFLFAGVTLTWFSIEFYNTFLGGAFDLYPGYYKGLGQIFRFLPLGVVVTTLTLLACWLLPKSKWVVGIFVPELIVDAMIIFDYLSFVQSLLGKPMYILPVYPCLGLGILLLIADLVFVLIQASAVHSKVETKSNIAGT